MNDKEMFEQLLKDKGEKYRVVVDNDCISVVDKQTFEDIYCFKEFGEEFIIQILNYVGLEAEGC